MFHWLTKGNSLKNSSIHGAGSGSEDCIIGGDGQGGSCDSGHDGSDIGSNCIGGCGGVGVRGETGSGEDGSGDRVMDTSDSGAEGGAVALPIPGALATAAIAVVRVKKVLVPLLLLITSLLR